MADAPRAVYVDELRNQEDHEKWLTILQVPAATLSVAAMTFLSFASVRKFSSLASFATSSYIFVKIIPEPVYADTVLSQVTE